MEIYVHILRNDAVVGRDFGVVETFGVDCGVHREVRPEVLLDPWQQLRCLFPMFLSQVLAV